ncbi:MAG: hypothetical protein ACRYG6_13330 [Janthinobacterium lividum]
MEKLLYASDQRLIPFADAEWIAGATCGHLHYQIAKGHIVPNAEDVTGVGTGCASFVTWQTMCQLAVFTVLRGMGIPPLDAGRAARVFTNEAGPRDRRPCALYDAGETILLLSFGMEQDGSLYVAGANVCNQSANGGDMPASPCHVFVNLGDIMQGLEKRADVVIFMKGRPRKKAPPCLVA